VRDRLLVIAVSGDYKSSPDYREIAEELHKRMQAIQNDCAKESYLPFIGLEYPSSAIEERQRHSRNPSIYEMGGMLSAPGQQGPAYLHNSPQSPPTALVSERDDIPQVVLRRPTGEPNLNSLSIQEGTLSDKQEVSD
jgi:hypothetical protein